MTFFYLKLFIQFPAKLATCNLQYGLCFKLSSVFENSLQYISDCIKNVLLQAVIFSLTETETETEIILIRLTEIETEMKIISETETELKLKIIKKNWIEIETEIKYERKFGS